MYKNTKEVKQVSGFKHLKHSIDRAEEEDLFVVKNGSPNSKDFIVLNNKKLKAYNVRIDDGVVITCSCQHAFYRGVTCKHQIKVSLETGLDLRVRAK